MTATVAETDCTLADLEALAERINAAHERAEQAEQWRFQHAIEAGTLLIEAKRQHSHGKWNQWVAVNCKFADRTARLYMNLARELPKLPEAKRQRAADSSLRGVTKLIAEDKRERRLQEKRDALVEAGRPTADIEPYEYRVDVGTEGREWVLELGPNEAGVQLESRLRELAKADKYTKWQQKVDDTADRASEMMAEADRLQREARKLSKKAENGQLARNRAMIDELSKAHGAPRTGTDQWCYVANGDEDDTYLDSLDGPELIAELRKEERVTQHCSSWNGPGFAVAFCAGCETGSDAKPVEAPVRDRPRIKGPRPT